jgi:hypothetical protein
MPERITPEVWDGLQAEMRAGHVGDLHEAQLYLRDTWHIAYGRSVRTGFFVQDDDLGMGPAERSS